MKIKMLQNRVVLNKRLSLEKDNIYNVVEKRGDFYMVMVNNRHVMVTPDECSVINDKFNWRKLILGEGA